MLSSIPPTSKMKTRLGGKPLRADRPDPVDKYVGTRLKQRRAMLHLSQEMVAKAVGVSFQQQQKYENGTNRISASRLFDFCAVLDVQPNFFFEDMPKDIREGRIAGGADVVQAIQEKLGDDPFQDTEILELVAAYKRVKNPDLRGNVLTLLRSLPARE